jgi:hypothetical protein
MTHTFVIRFGRSAGLAGLLEAPANSFRWKGSGSLSIDAQGLSIAAKRGILSLFARHRSQRIPASSITDVYREGEALRVEFATEANARTTLPFWAPDRETAAQIVQLLPTTRTFELEHGPDADEPRGRKVARRIPLMMAAAVVLIVTLGALFINYQRPLMDTSPVVDVPPVVEMPATVEMPPTLTSTGTPAEAAPPLLPEPAPLAERADTAAPPATPPAHADSSSATSRPITPHEARLLAMLAEDPVDWTSPPPKSSRASAEASARAIRMARLSPPAEPEVEGFVPSVPDIQLNPTDLVVPIPQKTLAYDQARGVLANFEALSSGLNDGFREAFDRYQAGKTSTQSYTRQLAAYRERWSEVGRKLRGSAGLRDPALTGFLASLFAVVHYRMQFLDGYAMAVRADDQSAMALAYQDVTRADEFLARARAYVN